MKTIKSSLILLLISVLSLTCTFAQNTVMDTTNQGKPMLFGKVIKTDYLQAPFDKWFSPNYDTFDINKTEKWQTLKKKINKYEITIFMGTWCGDSRREVPRMLKILEELDFNLNQLTIQTLNQLKQAKDRSEKGINIHRVPTLIVSKNGKEVNRIVESPVVSLEQDLEKIILGRGYESNYYGLNVLHGIVSKKGIDYLSTHQSLVMKKIKPYFKNAYEMRTYGLLFLRNDEIDNTIQVQLLNHELFPESDLPWYSLGEAYAVKGDTQKAENCYKKAIEINPENKYAKARLEQLGTN